MIDIDTFTDILDQLAQELPEEFFEKLNLGVSVSPQVKIHPQARDDDLCVMGEYFHNVMGMGIVIYYGSFARIHGGDSLEELRQEMRATLRHEFRHHMEERAMENGLVKEDERRLREYLEE